MALAMILINGFTDIILPKKRNKNQLRYDFQHFSLELVKMIKHLWVQFYQLEK